MKIPSLVGREGYGRRKTAQDESEAEPRSKPESDMSDGDASD